MKKITLPQDEINRYLDQIKSNPKLNAVFEKLTDLYGLPKWLNEINPLQSPDRIIDEWEDLFNKYADYDIMDAVNRLFKFRKSTTFPTAAHILAELPDDVQEVKHDADPKQKRKIPYELISVWNDALKFAASLDIFRSANNSEYSGAGEIRQNMTVKGFMWAQHRAERAMQEYLSNDPAISDMYQDDFLAQFVACYKAGVFVKIKEKIKQNINGLFEPKSILEEA